MVITHGMSPYWPVMAQIDWCVPLKTQLRDFLNLTNTILVYIGKNFTKLIKHLALLCALIASQLDCALFHTCTNVSTYAFRIHNTVSFVHHASLQNMAQYNELHPNILK